MKVLLSFTTGLLLYVTAGMGAEAFADGTKNTRVFTEDFDGDLSPMGQSLVKHKYVSLTKDQGEQGSQAIKVIYQGYERGSYVISAFQKLPEPAMQYQLNFSVRFCDNFDFVLGGKLHGLGPDQPVTGGYKIKAETWSARLMFERDGGLRTYVYHQDMKGKYGDSVIAKDFRFTPGQYHQVQMVVRLNTTAKVADGYMTASVDGVEVVRHEKLRFRGKVSQQSLINKVLFSTFHGGGSPEWAPRTKGKGYNAECAYFDNFSVSKVL